MNYRSFKIETPEGLRFRAIMTQCAITMAYNPTIPGILHPHRSIYDALWDTGATNTVISKKVVDELGLKPVSKTKTFHANGESIVDVYYVNVILPNNMGCNFLKVTQGILPNFDVLIGMDIIGQGEFIISQVDNKSIFEFRLPSDPNLKDIVLPGLQPIVKNAPEPPFAKKLSRNEPCHCGSGKKYKNCHGVGAL